VFNRDDAAMVGWARKLFEPLIADAARAGFGDYRAHIEFMQTVADTYDFNGHALWKLATKVEDALAPLGFIAPGRMGSGLRGRGSSADWIDWDGASKCGGVPVRRLMPIRRINDEIPMICWELELATAAALSCAIAATRMSLAAPRFITDNNCADPQPTINAAGQVRRQHGSGDTHHCWRTR